MIPSFQSGSQGETTDNAVSVITPFHYTPGDVLIAVLALASGTVTVTPPPGWTQIRVATSGAFRLVALRKVLTTGEPGFHTFALSQSVAVTAVGVSYSGIDTVTPVDIDAAQAGSSTTVTAPSVTTHGAERFVIVVAASVANTTLTTPTGTTNRVDATGAGTPAVRVSDVLQTAAGATGAKTSTAGAAAANIGYQLALKTANLPPNTPTPTAPVGGATFNRNAAQDFTWAFSDPDAGDTQTAYDLRYRLVGASSWTTVSASTAIHSRAFPAYSLPAGNYEWQVRTYDSHSEVSPWSTSALFTVVTPPPNAPTLVAPAVGAVLDNTAPQRFSWAFSDNVIGEAQSQFDLQYRTVGSPGWTTVTTATPNQFVDVAAGTIPDGAYEWQVRTYDSTGQAGAWSSSAFFTAATPPAGPAITVPINGELINASPITVVWSAPDQVTYQLRRVGDTAGSPDTGIVYFDTGEVTSTTARSVAVDLPTDNRFEHVQLRIRDSHGFLSPWADVRLFTSYDLPPAPGVVLVPASVAASISVTISNPAAGVGEIPTASNDVYRRDDVSDPVGIRVATALAPNSSWTDYTPASGVDYAYRVVAVGTNGLGDSSDWATADPDEYPAISLYPSVDLFPGA